MADTSVLNQPVQEEAQVVANPFGTNAWSEKAPEVKPEPVVQKVEDQKVEGPIQEVKKEEVEIIDEDDVYKREFGKTKLEFKKEYDELKNFKTNTPQEIAFINEDSRRLFESFKEGKEDDIYSYLGTKKKISKVEKLDVNNPKEAADLLRMSQQLKHTNLEPYEISDWFEEQYSKPEKPKKTIEQEDEEYAEVVSKWEARCSAIDRKIVRDAKMVQPDISKYKAELVLPDLPKKQVSPEADQKLLAEQQEQLRVARENFLNTLESNYSKAEGFSTMVKDESVEIPIQFKIPDEEKVAIKGRLSEGFDVNDFMDKRWFDGKGNPNVEKIISDIYLMENLDKILSGVATNSANKRLEHYRKEVSNINLNGTTAQNTFQPNGQSQNVNPFANNSWSEKPPVLNN